jgi:hypothetical protein
MRKVGFSAFFLLVLVLCEKQTRADAEEDNRAISSCSSFLSHEEINERLGQWAEDFSEIARVFSVGASVEQRQILALRISADPDVESEEPEIRIVGATHGNECISASLVLELIDWVLTGYGDDAFASDLVDGTEMVFIPLVNPDGYSSEPAGRYNSHGVDLNRNFGFGWIQGYQNGGSRPFTEPETIGMRELGQENNFALGLSYHTVIAIISGPWNYRPGNMEVDGDVFQAMSDAYAAGNPGYSPVPGFDWGSTNGDQNDWALGSLGTLDWTIEMRSDTDMEWDIHLAGFKNFLAYAFVGIDGVVTDADTGAPVFARIETDPEGVPVFTDKSAGDYHRVLMPGGTYDLTAFAQGYEPLTIEDVTVPDGGVTTVDFALEPLFQDAGMDGGADAGVYFESAAFAVAEMRMPQVINPNTAYNNQTWAFYTLGPPDGKYYSMSVNGSITLDMGEATWIGDVEGVDFDVISGTGSDDPVTVSVCYDQDGPFREVAAGSGDLEVDISQSGYAAVRYVRLESGGAEGFYTETPGYDLDAVVNRVPVPNPDVDVDTDTDSDVDMDADNDNDIDSDTDSDSDSDTDTDTDTETDADAGTDIDTDTDTDTDMDTDSDIDTDTGGDTDGDSDTGSETDTGSGADTDIDTDSDTSTDIDTETGQDNSENGSGRGCGCAQTGKGDSEFFKGSALGAKLLWLIIKD